MNLPVVSLLNYRGWHNTYFHWLLDMLPVLLFSGDLAPEGLGGLRVCLPNRLKPFQEQTLERIGLPLEARFGLVEGGAPLVPRVSVF